MDVNACRVDIAESIAAVSYNGTPWNAVDHAPEDVQQLPAALVNVPAPVEYNATLGFHRFEVALTLVVNANDYGQAQKALDVAVSSGVTGSVYDALHNTASTNIAKLEILRAENPRLVKAGETSALALDLIARVTAAK